MNLPSRFEPKAAARRFFARGRAWRKNASWQSRYARAQHGRASAWEWRLAVDLALLAGAVLVPSAILFWSAESEQQQLAHMPPERVSYVEGWKMSQTQSRVFFDTALPTPHEPSTHRLFRRSSFELFGESSQGWSIRCGRLHETLLSRRPPYDQEGVSLPTKYLRCNEGAQVSTSEASLSTKSLDYENRAEGYRLTTDDPVLVLEGVNLLSSRGGGSIEKNGRMRLFKNILFQAPSLTINAQGEALGKNFWDRHPVSTRKRRAITFKRDVTFSFQGISSRYSGSSQRMRLLPCPLSSKGDCRIFGNDALKRVVLKGSAVVSEVGRDAKVLWTLHAERVVVQDEQARYDGKKNGRSGSVRIVLADGTQMKGQRGGHNLTDDSGLLCGAVEVHSGEGVLTGNCLRYNLKEQRYRLESSRLESSRLESSAAERELEKDFFAL